MPPRRHMLPGRRLDSITFSSPCSKCTGLRRCGGRGTCTSTCLLPPPQSTSPKLTPISITLGEKNSLVPHEELEAPTRFAAAQPLKCKAVVSAPARGRQFSGQRRATRSTHSRRRDTFSFCVARPSRTALQIHCIIYHVGPNSTRRLGLSFRGSQDQSGALHRGCEGKSHSLPPVPGWARFSGSFVTEGASFRWQFVHLYSRPQPASNPPPGNAVASFGNPCWSGNPGRAGQPLFFAYSA